MVPNVIYAEDQARTAVLLVLRGRNTQPAVSKLVLDAIGFGNIILLSALLLINVSIPMTQHSKQDSATVAMGRRTRPAVTAMAIKMSVIKPMLTAFTRMKETVLTTQLSVTTVVAAA